MISDGTADSNYLFTRIVGSLNNIIGEIPFETGDFSKIVMRNAKGLTIQIKSSSYLPFTITAADWSGNYVNRAILQ